MRQPERHAGAYPPSRTEWDELKIHALEVSSTLHEPFRHEILRRTPQPWVPSYRPRVHEHHRATRHVVAKHLARAAALPRQQQWPRRVQPKCLLVDEPKVVQGAQAVLRHLVVAGECSPDLILRLPHHRRVPHQLGHCPLQRRRRRLAASSKHVLCVRWCVENQSEREEQFHLWMQDERM